MVAAEVEIVEHLGSEALVHTRVGGQVIVARTEPRLPVRPGDQVWLDLPLPRLHLFDRRTEQRRELVVTR
jgi:multiple sugar transport system ATP-binding protein